MVLVVNDNSRFREDPALYLLLIYNFAFHLSQAIQKCISEKRHNSERSVDLDGRLTLSKPDQKLQFSYNLEHPLNSWWYENALTLFQLWCAGLWLINNQLHIWDTFLPYIIQGLEEAGHLVHQRSDVVKDPVLFQVLSTFIFILLYCTRWKDGCWSSKHHYGTPVSPIGRNQKATLKSWLIRHGSVPGAGHTVNSKHIAPLLARKRGRKRLLGRQLSLSAS